MKLYLVKFWALTIIHQQNHAFLIDDQYDYSSDYSYIFKIAVFHENNFLSWENDL